GAEPAVVGPSRRRTEPPGPPSTSFVARGTTAGTLPTTVPPRQRCTRSFTPSRSETVPSGATSNEDGPIRIDAFPPDRPAERLPLPHEASTTRASARRV